MEYREIEFHDTSHLATESMGLEEVLKLFSNDILLLGSESLKSEREHVETVIMNEVTKVLSELKPEELGHWVAVVPRHHSHPYSHLPVREASIMLRPPHYLQVGHVQFCSFNTRTFVTILFRRLKLKRWCSWRSTCRRSSSFSCRSNSPTISSCMRISPSSVDLCLATSLLKKSK